MGGEKEVMKDMIKIHHIHEENIITELIMFKYMLIVKFLKKKKTVLVPKVEKKVLGPHIQRNSVWS